MGMDWISRFVGSSGGAESVMVCLKKVQFYYNTVPTRAICLGVVATFGSGAVGTRVCGLAQPKG